MVTSIELTKDDVANLIKEMLRQKGYNATEVTFTLGTEYHGYGRSETAEPVFTGAVAKVTQTISIPFTSCQRDSAIINDH